MSAWATVTPTNGQVAIDKSYTFYQTSNVEVFFTGGADWYGSSLVLDHEYTQINDGTQIGVSSSISCDLNLTTWATLPEAVAGTVASFSIWSSVGWTAFTFYIGNLHPGVWYNVFIDGILGPTKLLGTPISWDFAGTSGTHTFTVIQSATSATTTSLITMIFLFMLLGVAVAPLNLTIKAYKRKKGPNIDEIVHVAIIIVIGLTLIDVAWLVTS